RRSPRARRCAARAARDRRSSDAPGGTQLLGPQVYAPEDLGLDRFGHREIRGPHMRELAEARELLVHALLERDHALPCAPVRVVDDLLSERTRRGRRVARRIDRMPARELAELDESLGGKHERPEDVMLPAVARDQRT